MRPKFDTYGHVDVAIRNNMLSNQTIRHTLFGIGIVGSIAMIGVGCGLGPTGLLFGGILLLLASCSGILIIPRLPWYGSRRAC
jgi:hypothetical protein